MSWRRAKRFCGLVAAALALGGASGPAAPRRIVSLNTCADGYLIALADPGQIAGLTRFARDPSLSPAAAQASRLPITNGSVEAVLALAPDLVIASPFRARDALSPVEARGARVFDLPPATDLPGIYANVRRMAAVVGHPERGEALIARMEAQLAAIGPPPGRGRTAAYYQRRGYLTGGGSLIDEVIRRVGLVNLATRLGRPALSRMPLESLIAARPDFVLLDQAAMRAPDRGAETLRHPALDAAVPSSHRLALDQALAVCDGPYFPAAIAALARDIRAADRAEAKIAAVPARP
jgi:iron complex transport system substrate-binding protein